MYQRLATQMCVVATSLAGCTTIPAYVVNPASSAIKGSDQVVSGAAPAGPKVAALVANLKCSLWKAATSEKTLPYYVDDVDNLITKNKVSDRPAEQTDKHDPSRVFNLRNIFGEIEYVASVAFTLDVVDTSAFNPAAVITRPLQAASGLLPATSEFLAVGGVLSEAPHRFLVVNQAIDFARLVEPSDDANLGIEARKTTAETLPKRGEKCGGGGGQLEGDLGLEEALATGMIAASMSDISVFPALGNSTVGLEKTDPKAKDLDIENVKPGDAPLVSEEPISVNANNIFGVFSVQIDFTIIENINGGPSWVLTHFKGPAAGSQPLISLNRQVRDTLAITFTPICIRRKPESTNTATGRRTYSNPAMVDGTPGWANYLPWCDKTTNANKARAAVSGQTLTNFLQLNSIFQTLPH